MKKATVYSTLFLLDLFGMNGEQHTPSNETNHPSPVHLYSPALPMDERRPDAQLWDLPDSSSPQRTSNLLIWSAQDLKLATDQGDAFAQNNYQVCLQNAERVSQI
jgi:hypothetical protein